MGGKQCSVTHRNDAAAVHRSIKQFVLHPLPDISNVTPVHKASVVIMLEAVHTDPHRSDSLRSPHLGDAKHQSSHLLTQRVRTHHPDGPPHSAH